MSEDEQLSIAALILAVTLALGMFIALLVTT